MIAEFLIDKSAYVRIPRSPLVRSRLAELFADNQVATCPMIKLELLYSARSLADYDGLAERLAAFPQAPMNAATWTLALDLQHRLAQRGQHRRAIPDLLIAATALQHELTVLHYDQDFELIAYVSDLRQHWIAARGTID